VKFTEGGSITLALERAPTRDGDPRTWLRFTVRDTGIGMAPEVIAHLFEAFMQGDMSTTRRFGGTGLGLAISRNLVDSMGGSIRAESAPGRGTTFTIDLPFAPEPAPAASAAAEPRDGARRRLAGDVLVAEDNAVNREVVRAMLEKLGASVTVVENGEQAVALARERHFDLILMDCQMPVLDGYEATQRIRATQTGPRTPIVAFTANAFAEDRLRCERAGMDDYIAKPATRERLLEVLSRWLPQAAPAIDSPIRTGRPGDHAGSNRSEGDDSSTTTVEPSRKRPISAPRASSTREPS